MAKLGEYIRDVMLQKNVTVKQLSEAIHCERSNVYDIFQRDNIGSDLLMKISIVLKHNLFEYLSSQCNGELARQSEFLSDKI
ncbi:MAG: hypothetical protein ACI4BA_05115 [Prevotella sp.]